MGAAGNSVCSIREVNLQRVIRRALQLLREEERPVPLPTFAAVRSHPQADQFLNAHSARAVRFFPLSGDALLDRREAVDRYWTAERQMGAEIVCFGIFERSHIQFPVHITQCAAAFGDIQIEKICLGEVSNFGELSFKSAKLAGDAPHVRTGLVGGGSERPRGQNGTRAPGLAAFPEWTDAANREKISADRARSRPGRTNPRDRAHAGRSSQNCRDRSLPGPMLDRSA